MAPLICLNKQKNEREKIKVFILTKNILCRLLLCYFNHKRKLILVHSLACLSKNLKHNRPDDFLFWMKVLWRKIIVSLNHELLFSSNNWINEQRELKIMHKTRNFDGQMPTTKLKLNNEWKKQNSAKDGIGIDNSKEIKGKTTVIDLYGKWCFAWGFCEQIVI